MLRYDSMGASLGKLSKVTAMIPIDIELDLLMDRFEKRADPMIDSNI